MANHIFLKEIFNVFILDIGIDFRLDPFGKIICSSNYEPLLCRGCNTLYIRQKFRPKFLIYKYSTRIFIVECVTMINGRIRIRLSNEP